MNIQKISGKKILLLAPLFLLALGTGAKVYAWPFGNTGHLTGAPKEWANKRVFVKIISNNKNKSKSSRSDKHDS